MADEVVNNPGELEVADGSGISTEPVTQGEAQQMDQQTDQQIDQPAEVSTLPGHEAFPQGNLASFLLESEKRIKLINQTLLPLIEVALIELLGNSHNYRRFQGDVTAEGSNYNLKILYQVDLWVNTEVDPDAISHDANYIFTKIKAITEVKTWKQCSINTQEGTLTIECVI
jgi:hypothetical protein